MHISGVVVRAFTWTAFLYKVATSAGLLGIITFLFPYWRRPDIRAKRYSVPSCWFKILCLISPPIPSPLGNFNLLAFQGWVHLWFILLHYFCNFSSFLVFILSFCPLIITLFYFFIAFLRHPPSFFTFPPPPPPQRGSAHIPLPSQGYQYTVSYALLPSLGGGGAFHMQGQFPNNTIFICF